MNKAIFFDRDGVVNKSALPGDYIKSIEEFELLPTVVESFEYVKRHGYLAIVVTNQRCVARKIVSQETLDDIHAHMKHLLNGYVDAVYYCPHEIGDMCTCRKPNPGMLLEAKHKYNINMRTSWMIGDSEIDMEAARRAGCNGYLKEDNELLLPILKEII